MYMLDSVIRLECNRNMSIHALSLEFKIKEIKEILMKENPCALLSQTK